MALFCHIDRDSSARFRLNENLMRNDNATKFQHVQNGVCHFIYDLNFQLLLNFLASGPIFPKSKSKHFITILSALLSLIKQKK
jgi:hypothetical protein